MCQSCYAAVKEFVKEVGPKLVGLKKKLSREVVVYDAM
jgi:cytochrome c2